ncbi:hypothetical protein GCM10027280_59060 [Micromonospora polyrhachis]|uniref:Uncharacterized protein n=1 Tax=Micromonospora polyrhachis TaxID=1282883 RepID=A0A7W7SRF6_9ACTN|nr:hypothetical protein [Micromonospora polyrhachis]MBB4959590.1 hypothetical protein [Micromonospora polyrhachis]
MLKKLHDMGLTSDHCYMAGVVSIGISFLSWAVCRQHQNGEVERADRWGIFVGEWAPTLFALGNGLRTYEK